jgi:hypothetical protein
VLLAVHAQGWHCGHVIERAGAALFYIWLGCLIALLPLAALGDTWGAATVGGALAWVVVNGFAVAVILGVVALVWVLARGAATGFRG